MQKVKQIISFVLIALATIVAFQNMEEVKTELLFMTFELPRVVLLLCVFVFGFISGKLIKIRWKKKK